MHHKPLLDGVVISGGEPTLQEDLINLCEHIKRWGFSIKLDTNGSRPSVIKALLQKNLVDYVAMDIKTGADLYPPQLMPLTDPGAIYRSIRLIMSSAPAYEFRTTCVKPFITRSTLTSIGRTIRGADLYILQQCQPDEVLYPGFFESSDVLYTDAELLELKNLMDPWVCRCVVR